MTILVDIIPTRFRKYLYAFVAAAGLFLGALTVAGVQTFIGTPVGTIQDVYAFVVTATGLIAYANTSGRRNDEIADEEYNG